MNDPLDGIRLKRKRAWEQLNALDAEIRAFLDKDDPRPYDVEVKFDSDTGIVTISVKVVTPPNPMWSIRIGEILHNLRSSLDHLAFELYVLSNRKQTPKREEKIQFPIYWDAKGFDKRGREQYLKNIRSDAVDLIRAEQPFSVAEGGTGEGAKSPLWHLKELNEWDKHRTLHLTGTMLEKFNFTFSPAKISGRVEKEIRNPGPIHDKAVLVRARFIGVKEWPFADADVQCALLVHIAFDEGTPAVSGWLVQATLIDIANRTDRILGRMARDIFKTEL